MRAFHPLPLLLLVSFLVSGCAETQSCPVLSTHATIQEVSGNDLRVRLESGDVAVLHVGSAQVYRRDPDGCVPITPAEVTTGSNVAFHVDAWAASSPVQGWPAQVVVG